jgi:hypothetical protein
MGKTWGTCAPIPGSAVALESHADTVVPSDVFSLPTNSRFLAVFGMVVFTAAALRVSFVRHTRSTAADVKQVPLLS